MTRANVCKWNGIHEARFRNKASLPLEVEDMQPYRSTELSIEQDTRRSEEVLRNFSWCSARASAADFRPR